MYKVQYYDLECSKVKVSQQKNKQSKNSTTDVNKKNVVIVEINTD